jgi:hypothetical protein
MFGSPSAAAPGKVVQSDSAPVPHAKSEWTGQVRWLAIEATIQL